MKESGEKNRFQKLGREDATLDRQKGGGTRKDLDKKTTRTRGKTISNFADLGNLLGIEAPVAETQPVAKVEPEKTPAKKSEGKKKKIEHKKPTVLERIFDSLSEESRKFISGQIGKMRTEDKNTKGVLGLQQDPVRYIREALTQSRSVPEKMLLEKIQRDLKKSLSKNQKSNPAPKPNAAPVPEIITPEEQQEPVSVNEENPLADLPPPENENLSSTTEPAVPAVPITDTSIVEQVAEMKAIYAEKNKNEAGVSKGTKKREGKFREFIRRASAEEFGKPSETNEKPINVETIKKEFVNLSPEDKLKFSDGLQSIGFIAEKKKNDFFAKTFGWLKNQTWAKPTAGFSSELESIFLRNSKVAADKIEGIVSGKDKRRLANVVTFTGNVVKAARLVTDMTGLSTALSGRFVMMGAQVAGTVGEATKEARLKNSQLKDKVRGTGKFHTDPTTDEEWREDKEAKRSFDRAFDEAIAIYEKAGGKWSKESKEKDGGGSGDISTEALKEAYLREMPETLLNRIKNPSAANGFFQGLFKAQIETSMAWLNYKVSRINKNKKLSESEKKSEEKKLFKDWEKVLNEYEKMITDIGTVDYMAIMAKDFEKVSKGVVVGMTFATLYQTIQNGFELMHGHGPTGEGAVTVKTPAPSPSPTPENTISAEALNRAFQEQLKAVKVPTFHDEGITFDHGKGGIAGIMQLKEELQKEITEKFNGDISKAPQGVQDFLAEKDVLKQAHDLEFLNDKGESLKILKGATLRFDEEVGKVVSNNMGSHEYVPNIPKPEIMETVTVEHPEPILHKVPEEAVGEKIVAPKAPEPEIIPETKTNIPRQNSEPLEVERALGLDKGKIQPAEAFFDTHETPDTVEPLEKRWDEETIRNSLLSKMNDMDHHPAPVGVSDHAHDLTTKIIGNHFNFDQETLGKIDKVYEYFSQYKNGWEGIRSQSANFIMRGNSFKGYDNSPNMSGLLKNLVEVSGKKPHSGWFFGTPETVEHYVARALQYAATKEGMLEKLKLNK